MVDSAPNRERKIERVRKEGRVRLCEKEDDIVGLCV